MMTTENRELAALKKLYDGLIKRVDKAIAYFDNPDVPQPDKEKHFEEFRQLLKRTAETGWEIANWEGKR